MQSGAAFQKRACDSDEAAGKKYASKSADGVAIWGDHGSMIALLSLALPGSAMVHKKRYLMREG